MAINGARSQYDPSRPSLWTRVDGFLRALVPGGVTLILVLMSVAPTRLPGFVHVVPMVALISVYYWAITRPGAMGYVVAFLLGLVEDSLTGAPLGTSSVLLLLVQALIASQHKYFLARSFFVNWWGFGLIVLAVSLLKWLIVSAVYFHPMDPRALGFCAALTIAIYPVFAWILTWVNHLVYGSPE